MSSLTTSVLSWLNASEYRRRTGALFCSSDADDEPAAVAGPVPDAPLHAVVKKATATSQGRVFRYPTRVSCVRSERAAGLPRPTSPICFHIAVLSDPHRDRP